MFAEIVIVVAPESNPAAINASEVIIPPLACALGIAAKTVVSQVNVNNLDSFFVIDLFDL